MSFKKELARRGKSDTWGSKKGIAKKLWNRVRRRYGKEIVDDEIVAITPIEYSFCPYCGCKTYNAVDDVCETCDLN